MASESRPIMQHSLNGGIQFINETESIIHGKGDYGAIKRSRDDAGLDHTDSDNEGASHVLGFGPHDTGFPTSKSGKKTRGRVKIDMKYIDNKLRRYTTFSKRKTGIMKKAYELSTLTGTQVMLLVASETGHVYTFATRKLQPMITSDTGKALIQTCLNSPDVGQSSTGQIAPADQRMNPSGYEETEITYSQEEELGHRVTPPEVNVKQESVYGSKALPASPAYVLPPSQQMNGNNPGVHMVSPETSTEPDTSPQYVQASHPHNSKQGTMHLPTAGYVLPQSGTQVTPLSMAQFAVQPSSTGQAVTSHMTTQTQAHPVVQHSGSSVPSHTPESVTTPVLVTTPSSPLSQQGITVLQGGVNSMSIYQALQGMVCASPQQIGNLPEGFVLGVPQSSTLALPSSDTTTGGSTPQYITIPVPVSLAANTGQAQMFTIPITQAGGASPSVKKT